MGIKSYLLCIIYFYFSFAAFSQINFGKAASAESYPAYDDTISAVISCNNLEMWFTNVGTGSYNHLIASGGLYYPKGSGLIISYSDGPVIAGLVNGELRISGVKYIYSAFQPGPFPLNGNNTNMENKKIYQIKKNWESLPGGRVKTKYNDDYINWPIDLGAPYFIGKDGKKNPKFIGDTKSGLRSDDDPIQRGWIWEPGPPDGSNRFIASNNYTDWGFDCFGKCFGTFNSIGYPGPGTLFSQTTVKNNELKKVEIRFSSEKNLQQYAYRYLRNSKNAAADPSYLPFIKNIADGYPYQDFVPVPFTIWDIESILPVQLSCGFLENNVTKPGGNVDGKWRPTNNADGGREYLFIFSSPYISLPEKKYQIDILNNPIDMMYWCVFKERDKNIPFPNDSGANINAKLTLYPFYPISMDDRVTFSGKINSIKEKNSNFPIKFGLSQNYPNPFNPETNLEFSIPSRSFVELKIYNILGSEVTTLISEKLNPGNYQAKWNASGYSSGLYLIRLQADGQIFSRKMLLLK